jgi:hypothetical protein
MSETFDMTSYLVTVCPALGILAWVVVHFKGEIKKKDERIEGLTNNLIDLSQDAIKSSLEIKNLLEILKNK